jgi:hypothetical protein
MRRVYAALLIASLLAGCDQLSTGAGQGHNKQSTHEGTEANPSLPIGRFTIIHSPLVERDTVLLDTTTGDTWMLVRLGNDDNSPLSWQPLGKSKAFSFEEALRPDRPATDAKAPPKWSDLKPANSN